MYLIFESKGLLRVTHSLPSLRVAIGSLADIEEMTRSSSEPDNLSECSVSRYNKACLICDEGAI